MAYYSPYINRVVVHPQYTANNQGELVTAHLSTKAKKKKALDGCETLV